MIIPYEKLVAEWRGKVVGVCNYAAGEEDWDEGSYGWRLSKVRPLKRRIACQGALKHWKMDADAYAKEVENPRGLKPKFFSGSGSFHVVLPNLNHGVTQAVTQGVTQGVGKRVGSYTESAAKGLLSHETINETISETIRTRPGITRAALIALVGKSRATVARAVAELVDAGTIERRGSKKTGGYYARKEHGTPDGGF